MNINYFIDESGVEDWAKEKFFTITAVAMNISKIRILEEKVKNFKVTYSKRLVKPISYLHGSEITYGLNQGGGVFSKLHDDEVLANEFFKDLTNILADNSYQLVSLTLNLNEFMDLFNAKLDALYKGRNEVFKVDKIFNNTIYPLCLLQLTEQIRIHINSQKEAISTVKFFIEEKESDIETIKERCKNRFSDVNIEIQAGISKGSGAYSEIIEIADLAANAINGQYLRDKKGKDYLALKANISIQELIDKENLEKYMPFNF